MEIIKISIIKELLTHLTLFSLMFILIVGDLFIGAKGPLSMTDFETPLVFENYLKYFLYPFSPFALGDYTYPFSYNLFYILISFFSCNNIFLSQILILYISRLLAYFGMYLFLRKIIEIPTYISKVCSLFYSFSPPFIAWFSLPYQIFAGLVPLFFYLIFRLLINQSKNSELNLKRLYEILWDSLKISIIMSFILTGYFHGVMIVILLIFLAIVIFIISNKSNKKFLPAVCISIIFTFLLLLYLTWPFIEISFIATHKVQSSISQVWDTIFYKNAALINLFRLGGGSPWDLAYNSINRCPITIIWPILVFISLLFIRSKNIIKGERYKFLVQLWTILGIILLLGLLELLKYFLVRGWPNELVKLILTGLRRPERGIELLSFLYTILIGITFTHIFECLQKLKHSTTIFSTKVWISKAFMSIIILVVLIIIPYFFSFGIPASLSKESYAQLAKPMPSTYEVLQKVLTNISHDNTYRYAIFPFYSPLGAFLRLNYPNFIYASTFTGPNTSKFVLAINKLIVDKDFAFKYGMDLAHVKHILVLPDNMSRDELQAWRLGRIIRLSPTGYHFFGSPYEYYKLFSTSDLYFKEIKDVNGVKIFENKNVPKLLYIPLNIVIFPEGSFQNVSSVIQTLKIVRIIGTIHNLTSYAIIPQRDWRDIYISRDLSYSISDNLEDGAVIVFNTTRGSMNYYIIKKISLANIKGYALPIQLNNITKIKCDKYIIVKYSPSPQKMMWYKPLLINNSLIINSTNIIDLSSNEALFLVGVKNSHNGNYNIDLLYSTNTTNIYEGKYDGIIKIKINKNYCNNVIIPIVLGNIYNKNYRVFIDTNSSLSVLTYHSKANFYSNIFFVKISDLPTTTNLKLKFTVEYNKFEILLRKAWSFSIIFICLTFIFFSIIKYFNPKKLSDYKNNSLKSKKTQQE